MKQSQFTLCHGDFHASNSFLQCDKNYENWRPWFVDYSEMSIGVGPSGIVLFCSVFFFFFFSFFSILIFMYLDLAQMVISDLKPAFWKAHHEELLKFYWDELNVPGYSFEKCKEDFIVIGFERWIWMYAAICGMPQIPPVLIDYLEGQLVAFVDLYPRLKDDYLTVKSLGLFTA